MHVRSLIVYVAGLALAVPLVASAGDDRLREAVPDSKATGAGVGAPGRVAALDLIAASPAAKTRLNNLKVLSDKVDDVTTVENILRSFVRPGMTDQERARAIWTAAVKYRHQAVAPDECLAADWEAHDPVKILNVYGYCMCCCSSALVAALNRADGREARGRILDGHSVPGGPLRRRLAHVRRLAHHVLPPAGGRGRRLGRRDPRRPSPPGTRPTPVTGATRRSWPN